MAASVKASKSAPNHVIFKKTSRDKSVRGAERAACWRCLFACVFLQGAFARAGMIHAQTRHACFLSQPEMDDSETEMRT